MNLDESQFLLNIAVLFLGIGCYVTIRNLQNRVKKLEERDNKNA